MPSLPWEQPIDFAALAGSARAEPPSAEELCASFVFAPDDGTPFGNPVDGRLVATYLNCTPAPGEGDGSILAAFGGNGKPKTRRQVVLEGLAAGFAMAGAVADVGLSPAEFQAAVVASPGLARAVDIAMNKGDKANVGDGSGLSRWRFARTGNADKPEDAGDAGTDYNDMKERLRAILEPAPGWAPMFGANGAG